jgi:OHS family lactose permease-like MFS transporter
MYDRIGFEQTYIIMGATALTFTLISAFTLSACQSKWRGAQPLNVAEHHPTR